MGFFQDEAGNDSMNRLQSFIMVTGGAAIAIVATAWAILAAKPDVTLLGAMYAQASSMLFQGFMSKNTAKKIEIKKGE